MMGSWLNIVGQLNKTIFHAHPFARTFLFRVLPTSPFPPRYPSLSFLSLPFLPATSPHTHIHTPLPSPPAPLLPTHTHTHLSTPHTRSLTPFATLLSPLLPSPPHHSHHPQRIAPLDRGAGSRGTGKGCHHHHHHHHFTSFPGRRGGGRRV